MTLKDCYAALGGNYDDVIARLRSESFVQKYVVRFPGDESFGLLCRSLESGETQEAFRAAHTLKGMCQTLGFSVLERSSSNMTEALRGGDLEAGRALLEAVREDYAHTVDVIRAFQAEL